MNGLPYTLDGPPVPDTQYDSATGRIKEGYTVTATWDASGARIIVFVPKGSDYQQTADQLIRFEGEQLVKIGTPIQTAPTVKE